MSHSRESASPCPRYAANAAHAFKVCPCHGVTFLHELAGPAQSGPSDCLKTCHSSLPFCCGRRFLQPAAALMFHPGPAILQPTSTILPFKVRHMRRQVVPPLGQAVNCCPRPDCSFVFSPHFKILKRWFTRSKPAACSLVRPFPDAPLLCRPADR